MVRMMDTGGRERERDRQTKRELMVSGPNQEEKGGACQERGLSYKRPPEGDIRQ
jgi:hypothetical protein